MLLRGFINVTNIHLHHVNVMNVVNVNMKNNYKSINKFLNHGLYERNISFYYFGFINVKQIFKKDVVKIIL